MDIPDLAHTYDGSILRPIGLVVAILLFVGAVELLKKTDWYWEVRAAEERRAVRGRGRGRRGDRHSPPPSGRGRWWGRTDQDEEDEEGGDLEEYEDEEDAEDPRDLDEEEPGPRFHRYRPTSGPGASYRRRRRDLPADLDEEEDEGQEDEEEPHWSAPRRVRNADGTITEIPWDVDMRQNQARARAEAAAESEERETVEEFVARHLAIGTGYNEIVRQGMAAEYAGSTKMKEIIRTVKADLAARQN